MGLALLMAATQIKAVNWWHERFADWLIANPQLKLADAAKEFGVTVPWLSVVKNSDAFKEVYIARSKELTGKVIQDTADYIAGVREKTTAMTEIALDALNDRLAREAPYLPLNDLKEIADTGLQRLGYGAAKNFPSPVTINADKVAFIDQSDLAAARDKLMRASGVVANQPAVPLVAEDREPSGVTPPTAFQKAG